MEIKNFANSGVFENASLFSARPIFKALVSLMILLFLSSFVFSNKHEHKEEDFNHILMPCTSGLGGVVFEDSNLNGAHDESNGLEGIMVSVYDSTGTLIDTTKSDEMGNWMLSTGISMGDNYKIEFSDLGEYEGILKPSIAGVDNGSRVQFITAPGCANLGLTDPQICIDPLVAAICFARNNDQASDPTLVFVKTEDARDWPGPVSANDVNGLMMSMVTGAFPLAPM